jgi:hypothetical protein
MKLAVVPILVLASSTLGVAIEKQLLNTFDSGNNKPAKIEDVKPRIRSTARRQYIRYGPVKLTPSKVCP